MENNWRIADLIKKHLQDELTEDERMELDAWVSQSEANRQFFHRFEDPAYVARELQLMSMADTDTALAKTLEQLGLREETRVRPLFRKYAVAAAVLLVISTAAWWFLHTKPNHNNIAVVPPAAAKDVAAGTDKAILTLADGSRILLDSAANGQLAKQGAVQVLKKDGQLKYSPAYAKASAGDAAVIYNTVSTPRGGQYQLVLQDGTKVWLNAASTLKFPTSFSGKERKVELSGEGYFEVAPVTPEGGHQKIAFKVVTDKQEVEVLGTHFNVMAYNDEPQAKTTLLEGKVRVSATTGPDASKSKDGQRTAANGQRTTILSPGQQAQLAQSGSIKVDDHADIDQAVAWKNGMQSFHDADIQTIMRQVSRWYNIDVQYEGNIPSVELTGKIPRTISLKRLLEALELNSNLHFQLANGKVTVTP